MTIEAALPGMLAVIAAVTDTAAALQVAAAKGGTEVYIPPPHKLADGHWLVEAVGIDKARKIAEHLGGGGRIKIPLGPAGTRAKVWATIRRALAEGKSASATATLAGVDLRTVFRHKGGTCASPREDQSQPSLPFDEQSDDR